MMILRIAKADAAYLYQLLESYEGVTGYSTLDSEKGEAHRDILLHIAPDLQHELDVLLANLQSELSIEILSKP